MMVGASIYHFAKGLAARDFFTWRDLARFAAQQVRLRLRGESHGDMHSTRESALAFVAGKKVDEVVALGEEIYDESMSDKIWRGTHALARAAPRRRPAGVAGDRDAGRAGPHHRRPSGPHRRARHRRRGARRRSTPARWSARCCTARPRPRRSAQLAAREGLDLARCSAYSDSINDLPMLSLVGRAVAVNPDSALRAEAKRHGWEIRDFRTGRKAARIGIPAALGVGAAAGGVAAGIRGAPRAGVTARWTGAGSSRR